jgi:hypothetical protein
MLTSLGIADGVVLAHAIAQDRADKIAALPTDSFDRVEQVEGTT